MEIEVFEKNVSALLKLFFSILDHILVLVEMPILYALAKEFISKIASLVRRIGNKPNLVQRLGNKNIFEVRLHSRFMR
jgi:hypothetical protein